MTPSFNLLDEPWLPVRLADGRSTRLGLLDTFQRSNEIAALADTAPPNLVAHHRVLLAILHRALSRAYPEGWKDKDRARWYRDGLPIEAISEYLEHWRERFWLFHPECPFMQVAALAAADETRDKCKPWTQISLGSASGAAPVVFDHSIDGNPIAITPSEAICTLLGFLQFTPGGLVKVIRGSDNSGALSNTAALIATGAILAQTLALNLHPAPTQNTPDGLPAWERPPLTLAQLRNAATLATGNNDRYTRQSRAVLLLRETDGVIRWLRFAAGFALAEDDNAPDPMASFRASKENWVRLTFSEGKALWRDLPTLLPEPSGKNSRAAATLLSAIQLHQTASFEAVYQPVLIAGLCSDQAKLLRWRCEYMALPLALLKDADKVQQLRERVGDAERLYSELRSIGARMLAETLPDPAHKDTKSHARGLFDTSAFSGRYFAGAERKLPELLAALAGEQFTQAHALWNKALRSSAKDAWNQLVTGLGTSPRALRADAKFQASFYRTLKQYAPQEEVQCE